MSTFSYMYHIFGGVAIAFGTVATGSFAIIFLYKLYQVVSAAIAKYRDHSYSFLEHADSGADFEFTVPVGVIGIIPNGILAKVVVDNFLDLPWHEFIGTRSVIFVISMLLFCIAMIFLMGVLRAMRKQKGKASVV